MVVDDQYPGPHHRMLAPPRPGHHRADPQRDAGTTPLPPDRHPVHDRCSDRSPDIRGGVTMARSHDTGVFGDRLPFGPGGPLAELAGDLAAVAVDGRAVQCRRPT